MKWTKVTGHWTELEGRVRAMWGELTDDDLVAARGEAELLVGRIMARYGVSKEEAAKQVVKWADRLEEQLIAVEMAQASGDAKRRGTKRRRCDLLWENRRKPVVEPLGRRRWAIAEGYMPAWSQGPKPEFESHETACLLNTTDAEAHVTLTLFFKDREPAGPYRVTVGPRRTLHLRFNELKEPEPIPKGVDYASVIESDVPLVVQHTRLDSRQACNALLSTVAYTE